MKLIGEINDKIYLVRNKYTHLYEYKNISSYLQNLIQSLVSRHKKIWKWLKKYFPFKNHAFAENVFYQRPKTSKVKIKLSIKRTILWKRWFKSFFIYFIHYFTPCECQNKNIAPLDIHYLFLLNFRLFVMSSVEYGLQNFELILIKI